MAKSKKLQSEAGSGCQGASLHKLSSRCKKVCGDMHHEKLQLRASETKEWDNALCSVCLEFPHNAVLLLCSSYENGCRPYMCATSSRYSNCLEQYSKAYTKLLCPLCRGQVKGWTIVELARRYLNAKKRACMQENCSFIGTYNEIKKHVKLEHPKACPRDIDPSLAEKWKKFERERDLNDVFSTIRANMPGSVVLGDYVLEENSGISDDYDDVDDGDRFSAFFRFPAHTESWNDIPFAGEGDFDPVNEDFFRRIRVRATLASRSAGRNISRIARPHARFLFARQGRRSRERR